MTGRDLNDSETALKEDFRNMFPAQIIRDASMANKLHKLLRISNSKEKFLVICGARHMAFGHGVPERLFKNNENLKNSTFTIISRESDWN